MYHIENKYDMAGMGIAILVSVFCCQPCIEHRMITYKGVSVMKKVLLFLSLMALPLSLMAMTEVSDEKLSDVTGQSGVSINANLTMDLSIQTVAWGDADGLGTGTTGGYIGSKNLNLTNLTVSSQENLGADFRPITIDVATSSTYGPDVTFVRFGLGTLRITMPGQTTDISLGSTPGTDGAGLNQTLGQAYINLTALEFDPASYVDLWAGNIVNGMGTGGSGVGVNATINLRLRTFDLNTVSWGDTDGLGGGGTAGYIGLRNLVLSTPEYPIAVSGTISINAGSKSLGGATPTVCHIEFSGANGFVLNVHGPVTGQVVLSTAKELTGDQVLGDIYISSFITTIKQNSYVDIYAH
jgi:hypothetical protein